MTDRSPHEADDDDFADDPDEQANMQLEHTPNHQFGVYFYVFMFFVFCFAATIPFLFIWGTFMMTRQIVQVSQ